MDLTGEQWALVAPLIPPQPPGRGRPRCDDRSVLNAILYILRTALPWSALPSGYPPYQTCHRRYLAWQRTGVMKEILRLLYDDLLARGGLDPLANHAGGDICLEAGEGGFRLAIAPHLKGTWQLSTALIFLAPLLTGRRERLR